MSLTVTLGRNWTSSSYEWISYIWPLLLQPPKKDTKGSSKQPQKTQKKKEGGSGGKAKKKVRISPFVVTLAMDNFKQFNLVWCALANSTNRGSKNWFNESDEIWITRKFF